MSRSYSRPTTSRSSSASLPPSITHTPSTSITPLRLGPMTLKIQASTPYHTLLTLTIPPQTLAFPLISNPITSTTFHILSGSLRLATCTTEPGTNIPSSSSISEFDTSPGSTVSIPAGCFHGFANHGVEDAEVLCVHSPGRWSEALRELAGVRGEWMGEDGKAVLRKWGVYFIGDEMRVGEEGDDVEDLMFQPGLRCMA